MRMPLKGKLRWGDSKREKSLKQDMQMPVIQQRKGVWKETGAMEFRDGVLDWEVFWRTSPHRFEFDCKQKTGEHFCFKQDYDMSRCMTHWRKDGEEKPYFRGIIYQTLENTEIIGHRQQGGRKREWCKSCFEAFRSDSNKALGLIGCEGWRKEAAIIDEREHAFMWISSRSKRRRKDEAQWGWHKMTKLIYKWNLFFHAFSEWAFVCGLALCKNDLRVWRHRKRHKLLKMVDLEF